MKLFNDFEAVKFQQENLIFITNSSYLNYIYNPEYARWKKHIYAGNKKISVSNYPDISRDELIEAMQGVFPTKETDFIRLCRPSQLCIRDMMDLIREDFADYISDYAIYHAVHRLLLKSDVCYKSYEALLKLLGNATSNQQNNDNVHVQIKELSFRIIGRDIFKPEIGIVDGHDYSSYFWIMPARILDYSDTAEHDNVTEMRSLEISIEENDVAQYLSPFLYKHFDDELEANKRRMEYYWKDDNGNEDYKAISGFEWNLTQNYYTFTSMSKVLDDIKDTAIALSEGKENEFTSELKVNRGFSSYELLYAENLSDEEIEEYNSNIPKEDDTELDLVLDFYRRFIYRMEYMMTIGKENGCDLIFFMGP